MVSKNINFRDVYQIGIASFSATLFLFAVRQDPISINWKVGLGVTALWLGLLYYSFNGKRNKTLTKHFILAMVVTSTIAVLMGLAFGLITSSIIFTKEIFGSIVAVAVWISMPIGLLFDLKDLNSVLSRYKYMAKR